MANILLGVSAGIAMFKSADLASKLTQEGHLVRTLMTPHALKFMTPLAFRAVTRESVYTDLFEEGSRGRIEHIELSEWADLLLIAPATADLLGRLAAGLGDDILTATALAYPGPVLAFPAMNDQMWANPIVQENIQRLRDLRGYELIDPASGHLACGSIGPGRLPDPDRILSEVDRVLDGAEDEQD